MTLRIGCFLGAVGFGLMGCASSVPSNFIYETSLRGEQGYIGRADRIDAAESLLAGGIVRDPEPDLRAAMPDTDVRVRRWGLRYFGKNWNRYQVVLEADIAGADKRAVKCRLASPETVSGAPSLPQLRANAGAQVQQRLEGLVKDCAAEYAATKP